MKRGLAAWLERRWYGGVAPEWPLRSLAALVEAVARRRRARHLAHRARLARVALPQIVVGNLALGGSGKTPLTIALVDALRARGWRPGVISRGYGGSTPGPERVLGDSAPARVGDEPALIVRRTGAPVAIAHARSRAAELLAASGEVDLLIADDGLQHYALARDIEIAVVDGRRRYGNGRLLPAGPLREPPERAAGCDFVVVNGGEAQAGEVAMRLELGAARALVGGEPRSLQDFAGARVHAVAGIGDPERFFAALRALGLVVEPHPFPDHHAYSAGDFAFAVGVPLLMTEKDAVKCSEFAAAHWYVVPVEARLPEEFYDAVDARLRALRDGSTPGVRA
jgi:tetraacyldisaccharide 4'-kinase